MKKEGKWIVGDYDGIRPAGKKDECFYCRRKVGEEHADGCVIRRRTVVINVSFDVPVVVPESWTEEQIEFHHNESSWCANNMIDDLDSLFSGENGVCLCFSEFEASYLREMSKEDEESYDFYLEDHLFSKSKTDGDC